MGACVKQHCSGGPDISAEELDILDRKNPNLCQDISFDETNVPNNGSSGQTSQHKLKKNEKHKKRNHENPENSDVSFESRQSQRYVDDNEDNDNDEDFKNNEKNIFDKKSSLYRSRSSQIFQDKIKKKKKEFGRQGTYNSPGSTQNDLDQLQKLSEQQQQMQQKKKQKQIDKKIQEKRFEKQNLTIRIQEKYEEDKEQEAKINFTLSNINKSILNNSNNNTIMEENSFNSSNVPLYSSDGEQEAFQKQQKAVYPISIVKMSLKRKKYPAIKMESGHIYEGEWKEGKQDGFGISQFPDFSRYEGNFVCGKACGRGILSFQDGDYYIGDFQDDKQHGQGRYVQNNKEYNGGWDKGRQHGRGVEVWGNLNENKYEGAFENGSRQGKGKLEMADRFTYAGDFKDNFMTGYGTIKFHDGRVYEGQFQENRMHGKGKMVYKNNIDEYYQGEFINDNFEGIGTYQFKNGNRYIGEWKQGKMHGEGQIVNTKGERLKGIWVMGKLKTSQLNMTQTRREKLILDNSQSLSQSSRSIHSLPMNQKSNRQYKARSSLGGQQLLGFGALNSYNNIQSNSGRQFSSYQPGQKRHFNSIFEINLEKCMQNTDDDQQLSSFRGQLQL